MRSLESNDWMVLAGIIYKIHSIENITQMQKSFLESIKYLIPYEVACFYLVDSSGKHFANPVGAGNDPNGTGIMQMQDYIEHYEDIDYTNWIFNSTKSIIFRETDLLQDEVRVNTTIYKNLYEPYNIHFSVQLGIVHDQIFQGVASFFRPKDQEEFSERDLFVLDMLKDHLSLRLFKDQEGKQNISLKRENSNLEKYCNQFKLTKRESEVFHLTFEELTDKEICDKLFISANTFKKHILNIYKKAEVNSRIQLMKLVK